MYIFDRRSCLERSNVEALWTIASKDSRTAFKFTLLHHTPEPNRLRTHQGWSQLAHKRTVVGAKRARSEKRIGFCRCQVGEKWAWSENGFVFLQMPGRSKTYTVGERIRFCRCQVGETTRVGHSALVGLMHKREIAIYIYIYIYIAYIVSIVYIVYCIYIYIYIAHIVYRTRANQMRENS